MYTHMYILLPIGAVILAWGHYWDAENCMTISSMVAPTKYRGTASGFAYIFVKLSGFLSIFLFPMLFSAIGKANATLFVSIFSLMGFLAALFILPEIYGFVGREHGEKLTGQVPR